MEPVTFTAGAIASLAFVKFLEKASERYSDAALNKVDELCGKIRERFRGNAKAEKAIQAIEAGEKSELSRLSTYLQDEMEDDGEFAALIEALAKEIKAGEQKPEGQNIQNNYDDSTGFQNIVGDGGKAFIAKEIKFYGKPDD